MPYKPTDKPIKDEPRNIIYWSKAARFTLANFVKEIKNEYGRISQDEISISFNEHIYATSDPQAQKYLEDSKAFKIGRVKKCANHQEAAQHTATHNAVRAGVVTVENLMQKDVYSHPAER